MTKRNATILFEFRGRQYEFDGALPELVVAAVPHLFDAQGFFLESYPAQLASQSADAEDESPAARWEIEHVGGRILEVRGARANGAIHHDDWRNPVVH